MGCECNVAIKDGNFRVRYGPSIAQPNTAHLNRCLSTACRGPESSAPGAAAASGGDAVRHNEAPLVPLRHTSLCCGTCSCCRPRAKGGDRCFLAAAGPTAPSPSSRCHPEAGTSDGGSPRCVHRDMCKRLDQVRCLLEKMGGLCMVAVNWEYIYRRWCG